MPPLLPAPPAEGERAARAAPSSRKCPARRSRSAAGCGEGEARGGSLPAAPPPCQRPRRMHGGRGTPRCGARPGDARGRRAAPRRSAPLGSPMERPAEPRPPSDPPRRTYPRRGPPAAAGLSAGRGGGGGLGPGPGPGVRARRGAPGRDAGPGRGTARRRSGGGRWARGGGGTQSLLGRPGGEARRLGFKRPPGSPGAPLPAPPAPSRLSGALPGLRGQGPGGCRPLPAEDAQAGRQGRAGGGTPGPSQPTPRGSPAQ